MLYEFLTGVNPFRGKSRQETFQAILTYDPDVPSSLNPEIPPELDRILIKMLEKDPALGYQSAGELRTDLKRVQREIDPSPASAGTGIAPFSRPGSAKRVFAAAAIAIVGMLAAAPLSGVHKGRRRPGRMERGDTTN